MDATIHDVLGRKVASLYSGWIAGGTHTLHWDAGGAPVGICYYWIRAGQLRVGGKLILAR